MKTYSKQCLYNVVARWSPVLVILTLACSTVLHSLLSKNKHPVAWHKLKSELYLKGLDTSYIDGNVIDINSSVGTKKISEYPICNPYGILRDCFVFAIRTANASVDTNAMIVIMKKGRIIWMSKRFDGELGGKIISVMDLKKDSTVDILSQWIAGGDQAEMMLWIHSWDGKRGRAINAVDSTEDGRVSLITGFSFEIEKTDEDSIFEIRAQGGMYESGVGFTEEETVIYRWNGSQYAEWKRLKGREE